MSVHAAAAVLAGLPIGLQLGATGTGVSWLVRTAVAIESQALATGSQVAMIQAWKWSQPIDRNGGASTFSSTGLQMHAIRVRERRSRS